MPRLFLTSSYQVNKLVYMNVPTSSLKENKFEYMLYFVDVRTESLELYYLNQKAYIISVADDLLYVSSIFHNCRLKTTHHSRIMSSNFAVMTSYEF